MRALVLPQIPNPYVAPSIARNQLPLIRMNDDVVNRGAMQIIALDTARARIPDLHRAVLGARHHPLPLAVERDAGDVARVAVEGEYGVGVRGADVVKLDIVVSGGGEIALVGGDAETIDLGVRVLDCAGADAGKGFPEADRVVVTSCRGGRGGLLD